MKRRDLLDKATRSATLRRMRTEQRHRDAVARHAMLDASVKETEASIQTEHGRAKACIHSGCYSKADYARALARQAESLDALAMLQAELDSLVVQQSTAGDEIADAGRARQRAEKKREKIVNFQRNFALAAKNAVERSEIDEILEVKSYVR
ncbi:hypothetical protein [Xanthomonas albilineans]|uniref:Probable xsa-associated protein n=1 Tax=Xanthomonas albilineans (strain GPE PC73 / CFBP 7063) TaxID=380358 RepID=D2UDN2_XANAP|nr:hypothetical protein [Xanthomonas albilineans]QHQ28222.1 putative xsa-associated protein [Xanthomonas albilineans]CBA16001.1 probable xsa-associated protein [Xanthomonas albilineans GPE PC73]